MKKDNNSCKSCEESCCYNGGCKLSPVDFDNMRLKYLEEALDSGVISISSILKFKIGELGFIKVSPILYLRVRNVDRDEIDLLSLQTMCTFHSENGCALEKNDKNNNTSEEIIKKWKPYQRVLRKLVKKRCGMTVDKKLEEEVEMLFVDLMSKKDDEGCIIEIQDFEANVLPFLIELYPEQLESAQERFTSSLHPKLNRTQQ